MRQQKRFKSRAKAARLRHLAAVEDVDDYTPRGLDRIIHNAHPIELKGESLRTQPAVA